VVRRGSQLALVAIHPAAAADVEAGKTAFRNARYAHTTEAGKNKVGPSLFGVVGRKSASLDGYNYSEAMKKFDHNLGPADPRCLFGRSEGHGARTKMIYPGINDKAERDDVIGLPRDASNECCGAAEATRYCWRF